MEEPAPIEVDAIPDYKASCTNCGTSPVVTLKEPSGKITNMKLCGPCCFGEAACIDPDNW